MFKKTFTRRAKLNLDWIAGTTTGSSIAAGAGSLSAGSLAINSGSDDVTLKRVRGSIWLYPNTPFDTSQIFAGAVGIIKCTDRAATVGVTALERPWTDGDADWIWHAYFQFGYFQAAVDTAINNPGIRLEIDSKAQRRMDNTEQIAIVLENQGTTQVNFIYGTRCLFSTGRR